MARSSSPLAPRVSAPDLAPQLAPGVLESRAELVGVRIDGVTGSADASYAYVSESALTDLDTSSLDLTRGRFVDVDITDLRSIEVRAREAHWQTVRVIGGRVATLDLARSSLSGVEVRGMRIDYLTLSGAEVSDVLFVDCVIGSLDAPQAALNRVAFAGCQVDDVDNRGWKIENLDLRGLAASRYLDMPALRGATMDESQVTALARHFAVAAGVDVRD